MEQLFGAQVKSYLRGRQSGFYPVLTLLAGDLQGPPTDGDDRARCFGEGEQSGGRDRADAGMLPAQEGFPSDDLAAISIDLGLVAQIELPFLEGLQEVVVQFVAQLRSLGSVGGWGCGWGCG